MFELDKENVRAARAFEVAEYICSKFRASSQNLTAMKLQKLLYYCQAWSLVWMNEPIFIEEIQAWSIGPIVKEVYEMHKGQFYVENIFNGDPNKLDDAQKDTVDGVLKTYGDKTAQWLNDLIHLERPWSEARNRLNPGDRGSSVIKLSVLYEYYSELDKLCVARILKI